VDANILVVEDDALLGSLLRQELRTAGYVPRLVNTGGEALFQVEQGAFDLVVLDLNLPDMDGLEVAEWLAKAETQHSILMLTARGGVEDRIDGLYAGASDYMTKPFVMQEFLARVHARLRERGRSPNGLLRYDNLTVDIAAGHCLIDDKVLVLPELELQLLYTLLSHQGRLFSRSELEQRLYQGEVPDSNTIEVFVYNIRRKLKEEADLKLIKTVRGRGYMIV
jgi:DNA-binding response OmpR family regulator